MGKNGDDMLLHGPTVYDGRSDSSEVGSSYDNSSQQSDNEIQAVRDDAKRDTWNIRVWRLMVTFALLATGLAVTYTTYRFLKEDQTERFKNAFEQFSGSLARAAVEQQHTIQTTYRGLANSASNAVKTIGGKWPAVSVPHFNAMAETVREESRTEIVTFMHAVRRSERRAWENFTMANHEAVMEEAQLSDRGSMDYFQPFGFIPTIVQATADSLIPATNDREIYFPGWEFAPAPFTYSMMNWDFMAADRQQQIVDAVYELRNQTLYMEIASYGFVAGLAFTEEDHQAMHDKITDSSSTEHPHSFFYVPVHETAKDYNSPIVGLLGAGYAWDAALRGLLPNNVNGIHAIVSNTCNQTHTYVINGPSAFYEGEGDLHDKAYNRYLREVDLAINDHADFASTPGHCRYKLSIYPSRAFQDPYEEVTPRVFAAVVLCAFFVVIVIFFVYDRFVYHRNERLIQNAARSNAIVSTLFPRNIRDRLFAENQQNRSYSSSPNKQISNLKSYLKGENVSGTAASGLVPTSKPLADLFLDTSILFADIAGFTAWSSVREPSQVFSLLENIFASFDQVAKARKVFKVETVGDCYVAATGIPDRRDDHAVVMVRFARDILTRMHVLVKELEITHGPDTGDLSLRVGIHSGPVTAGVLRGERARFQLFGDTMNTASRIEHSGEVGRIHVSTDTAESLKKCGKGEWLLRREESIDVKGKGDMQTYWIAFKGDRSDAGSVVSQDENVLAFPLRGIQDDADRSKLAGTNGLDEKHMRLVDWNVEMLSEILRKIITRRAVVAQYSPTPKARMMGPYVRKTDLSQDMHSDDAYGTLLPFEEVREIISLPEFDNAANRFASAQIGHGDGLELDKVVVRQLRSLVSAIASMYRHNSFHNFEHASHVTMSVIKLLARIVAPTDLEESDENGSGSDDGNGDVEGPSATAKTLYDHTYGITSDPLTQFACAFSALIHDVDHMGVPNAQLVKENARIAHIYKNKSVAEQNSLALAWDFFMSDEYSLFRQCLCPTESELQRFRQLVVNCVMATDIVDKELKQLRNDRWDKAFTHRYEENPTDARNRKATIVIEHLIQASDVAHTMQHWHVYRKWNERFFRECYAAYKNGRAESDPSITWYKGELGFFDFYIIPLAKKLKDCGVFGKSSDEYLNYAQANRREWERRGEEVVAEMVQSVKDEK